MAVDYKKIGLVNTKEMFARAIKGGWAVPAFNFNNLEQLQAIIQASSNLKSPVILQVSKGARKYANPTLLRYLAEGAVEYAKELGCNHPEQRVPGREGKPSGHLQTWNQLIRLRW